MKTRIVHTKIWEDDEYLKYSKNAKLLFMYCITNHRIGLTGIYELPAMVLQFSTGLTEKEIEKAKKELEANIAFYKDYVFVFNAGKYSGFNSPKHADPRKKEVDSLPEDVRVVFQSIDRGDIAYRYPMDRVYLESAGKGLGVSDKKTDSLSIGYTYPTDTLINKKQEIINNNIEEDRGVGEETVPEPMTETVEDSANALLEKWNTVFETKYTSIISIVDNLKFWLTVYTFQEILDGVDKIKIHHFWHDKMKPETYLRKKNPQGEKVDYIGEMKNYKPKKDFKNENNSKYEKL